MDIRIRPALGPVALLFTLCLALLAFFSCSPVVGWGVVLWDSDDPRLEIEEDTASNGLEAKVGLDALEGSASDAGSLAAESSPDNPDAKTIIQDPALEVGQVVPIYLKSSIQKLYVVGVPGTKRKTEISQWRLESFASKGGANAYLRKFKSSIPLWGIAMRDGLVIRSSPDNTGNNRVYRLRERELVKILQKTEGVEVKSGEERLEGDWFQVLSGDGTRGYAFSNTLKIFDMTKETAQEAAAGFRVKRDDSIDAILTKPWRPEIFRTMIDDRHYDLDEFSPRYGLFTDLETRTIRLELPNLSKTFGYKESLKLRANLYGFDGNSLQIQLRSDELITLSYPDNAGKTRAIVMVLVEEDMEALAREEEGRRQAILESILAKGKVLISDSYGQISLSSSRRFVWTGYERLVPGVIPRDLGSGGEIVFDRYVDEDLDEIFSGVLNFRFDQLSKGETIRFYYTITLEGLRLEQMPFEPYDPTGLVARRRRPAPVVAFFSHQD